MFSLIRIPLPTPITLRIPNRMRGQAIPTGGTEKTLTALECCFQLAAIPQTIHAQIAGLPRPLLIYGSEDFREVVSDLPEHHAERVLQVLGTDLATALQSLCDGEALPSPPTRVPREIPNWRGKAVLHAMGLLPTVEAALVSLPEPDRTVALLAWNGDAKLARHGKTVLWLADALGLSDAQIDQIFIQAGRLEV